jgi:GT2 family glycosyltransferase/glycosyltransferase involved in cell wall biosynthesis
MEAGRFSAVIRMMHRLARVPDEVRHRLRWQLIDLADQSLIRRSRLFDSEWYLAQNPDVVAARINPLRHYLRHAREGRDPNPLFDSNWYLARNPDVAAAGVNPLVHYLRNGAAEGRDPNPWFDSDWYLAQNPDVAAAGINPLVHYLHNGVAEGRNPSPSFDARCYLAQNPDVAAAGINALVHFRLRGIHEGRVAPVATEFPQGLSFFRFTRQHRLGYVVRTAELSDDAASRPGGPHHAHSDQLPASYPRQAEPLNDAADIIAASSGGIGRSRVSHFRTMVVLTHRCMRLLRRAISVLVRQGPQTFVVKVLEVSHFRTMVVLIYRFMYLLRRAIGVLVRQGPQTFVVEVLEALRARLASPSGRPFPKYSNDLPPSRLGQQHHSGDALDNDELLEDSPSPIPGVRSIQIDKLLPSRERVAEPPSDRRVDVIVPVYRGFDETRRCLESVLGSRVYNRAFGRVLLIDDCGPEPELRAYLSEIARQDAVVLLTNPANMGFVASINRGMAYAAPNDVILLNSDTEVCGNWLDRLSIQAYADVRIGTVTPLSNNATICSYPDLGGQSALPTGTTLRAIDTACAQANALRAVQIPTAVGSCMYIKRSCLDHIGVFDESTFAEGYGEETDFCQRASRRGWIHMLAGDIFVFHAGETSFGASGAERRTKASAVMRDRHPGYEPAVARWVRQDPALPLRLAATAALWRLSKQPVVLHVLHSWGGGTEKHVAEIAGCLATSARHLVLVTKRSAHHVNFLLLIPEPPDWRAVEFASATMADVVPFLRSFGLTQAHVHGFANVLDQISPFLKQLALPYDITIHDYAAICPRVNLVKHDAIYCGEPDEKGCLSCLLEGGYKLSDDILWWRHHGLSIIREADRVLCPSIDAGRRIRNYVSDSRIIIAPHEGELYRYRQTVRLTPLRTGELLRVAVLGVLSEQKGGNFFLDCVEVANDIGAPIAWKVIGNFLSSSLQARVKSLSKLFSITGSYQPGDLQQLIREAAPHVLLFSQRCPETYSFTLSEALQAGHPILAPRIGSLTERLIGLPYCCLYSLETTPRELVRKLVSIQRNYVMIGRPFDDEVEHWMAPTGMSPQLDFYRDQYVRARLAL